MHRPTFKIRLLHRFYTGINIRLVRTFTSAARTTEESDSAVESYVFEFVGLSLGLSLGLSPRGYSELGYLKHCR